MDIRKRHELSAGFQYAHHFVEKFDLHRLGKRSPGQPGDNAIDFADAGLCANFPGIRNGILEDAHLRMSGAKQIGEPWIDLNGNELGFAVHGLKDVSRKRSGTGAVFDDGSGM